MNNRAKSQDDPQDEKVDVGGIARGFEDTSKKWQATPADTRAALLGAMGIDPADPQPPSGPAVRILGPGDTLSVDQPAELTLEDGTVLEVRSSVPTDVPIGYHKLCAAGDAAETLLIKRPAACHLDAGMKAWGWAVSLYASRSRRSWGHGDLSDLRQLARWAKASRTDMLLLNPLCATTPVSPLQASPYYPSSRRFHNPLYIGIDDVVGGADPGPEFQRLAEAGRQLNESRRIDRDAIFPLKMRALEQLWVRGVDDGLLDAYCRELGDSLHIFATFCALAEQLGADWRTWPEEYRRPKSEAVRRFAESQAGRVRFHQWLQWLLDQQLARAAAELPVVNDLPIGVDPGGADAWQWQDVLAGGVTVGAPPDLFNANGQDWSLPPFIPHRLRAAGYQPFIETIRSSLRHAGGLRIDHVMGLFRLYWIPEGFGPRRGAYVRYPADELLAVVAVESHRAGAWVAGEDLGTVEDGVRDQLADNKMLSYKLMWFEDDLPEDYPQHSLAAISTHDLPTVAGMWTGEDFAAQQRIGLNPTRDGYQQIRRRLVAASGLADDASPDEAVRAAYTALGRAKSAVLVANLEDALSVVDRPNMPGTTDQWPNWSLPLPVPIEELEQTRLPAEIARSLNRGE